MRHGTSPAVSTPSVIDVIPTAPALPPPTVFEPEQDVQLTPCQVEPNMFATISKIQVKVTNQTARSQSYWVTVALNSQDGASRYGEATGVTSFLGPGQIAVVDVPGLFGQLPESFVCSVAKVTRLPA